MTSHCSTRRLLDALFAAVALGAGAPALAQSSVHLVTSPSHFNGFGEAVAGVGDLDQDGFAEFVVGERDDDTIATNAGKATVFSGRTGAVMHEFFGENSFDQLGLRVAAAGDVDNDGTPDIAACAFRWRNGAGDSVGAVYVYSGATGAQLYRIEGSVENDEFGYAVSTAGDTNGDGHADLLVGVRFGGQALIFSGADGSLLHSLSRGLPWGWFGYSVAPAGDIDGDGFDDVVVGSNAADHPTLPNFVGRVGLYSGSTGALIREWFGTSSSDWYAVAISSDADLNGDDVNDVLVSARFEGLPGINRGRVRIYSGADGTVIREHFGATDGERLGYDATIIGDFNGDGVSDYAASSLGDDNSGVPSGVTVWSGADGTELLDIEADFPETWYGLAIAAGGDVSGNGLADLVVGRPKMANFTSGVEVIGFTPPNGGLLCKGLDNSTGSRAQLVATSPSGFSVAANDLTLEASQLPPNTFSLMVVSNDFLVLPVTASRPGKLCIASLVMGRYTNNVMNAGPGGTVTMSPDLAAIPQPMGSVAATAGDTFNFQLWYRDLTPTMDDTSNFSDAVTVTVQ